MKTRYACALVLLLLAAPALAQTRVRNGRFGDRITGDIQGPDEIDMFVDRAVAGSSFRLKLVPDRKSSFRAAFWVFSEDDDFTSLVTQAIPLKGGRGWKSLPLELPATGRYRVLVFARKDDAGNPFGGRYVLTTKVKPPKKISLVGAFPPEGGTADAVFAVLAGSTVTLSVKGGPGSPLPEVTDLLDPDGASILDPGAVAVKKKAVVLKKVLLPKFGEYTLRLSSPTPGEWNVRVKVRAPKRKAEKIEVLDPVPPAPDPVTADVLGGEPRVTIEDETGGPNRLYLLPGENAPIPILAEEATACGQAAYPIQPRSAFGTVYVDVPNLRGGPDEFVFLPGSDEPDWYLKSTSISSYTVTAETFEEGKRTGFTLLTNRADTWAVVSGITYDEAGLVSGFGVESHTRPGLEVRSGTATVSGVVRDADGVATGWTEVRTYDGLPETFDDSYAFTVRDVVREEGAVTSYRLDVTEIKGAAGMGARGPWDPIPYPWFLVVPPDDTLVTFWLLDCGEEEGFGGFVHDVRYEEGSVEKHSPVTAAGLDCRTPDGPGRVLITSVTRAEDGRAVGWTETRTYYGPGDEERVYTLVFRDVVRKEVSRQMVTMGYHVDVTGPEGPLGTFAYPAWKLPPEPEKE